MMVLGKVCKKLLRQYWFYFTVGILLSLKNVSAAQLPLCLTSKAVSISLDARYLPVYTLYTLGRILIALMLSCIISLWIGRLIYENKAVESITWPALDVLQSIPITGFLTLVTVAFVNLFPQSLLGAHLSIIFALMTTQVWNMIISVYDALNMLPEHYRDLQKLYKISQWNMFWKIELPFIAPSLLWNIITSMSASWVMVVNSESLIYILNGITNNIEMPGIGSFINKANIAGNYGAILGALMSILISILLFDIMLFKPLMYRLNRKKSQNARPIVSHIITYLNLTYWLNQLCIPQIIEAIFQIIFVGINYINKVSHIIFMNLKKILLDRIDLVIQGIFLTIICYSMIQYSWLAYQLPIQESIARALRILMNEMKIIKHIFYLGLITMLRVFLVLIISTVIMVPLGIIIGRRAKLAKILYPIIQICASCPLNIVHGIFAYAIIRYNLNFNFLCIILILLASMWYILFSVIEGCASISRETNENIILMKLKGWALWKKILIPSVFPNYVSGIINASGAAWNCSVICEYIQWSNRNIMATGLGAFITKNNGNSLMVLYGVGVMSFIIVVINRYVWQKLMRYTERKYQNKNKI